jgi:hypothetical protein
MIVDWMKAEGWDRAAQKAYFPCVSYRYGWMTAISESFPHLEMVPLAKIGESGEVLYVCPCLFDPKKGMLTSSSLLSPGFITANVHPDEIVDALIEATLKRKGKSIELQVPPGYWYLDSLLRLNFSLIHKVTFFDLELEGIGSFDEFSQTHIDKRKVKNINTSYTRGVSVQVLSLSEESVQRFLPPYLQMIDRHGSTAFPTEFFFRLGRELNDCGKVWIASVEGIDAGSAITFESFGRIWAWFLQGNREFKRYKIDERLEAEIIRYSIENKIPVVDLGTSPLEGPLAEWKLKFGAKPVFHEAYRLEISTKARLYFFLGKGRARAAKHDKDKMQLVPEIVEDDPEESSRVLGPSPRH